MTTASLIIDASDPVLRSSALAVDVGGTKIAAAAVGPDGAVSARTVRPTPRSADAGDVLAAVVDAAEATMRSFRGEGGGTLAVCGAGAPGRTDGHRVYPVNIPSWTDGFPLRDRLEGALGIPTVVDNDANLFALGEGACGAATGRDSFLGMVLSTGIGGAVVLEGRLVRGVTGSAGEIGHVCVVPDGRLCPCGARGCLEAETSGPAIEAITGRPPSAADAATVARAGDLIGRAVAMAAALLDLDFAVIGGSVALGFGAPFFAAAQASARAHQPTGAPLISVSPALLGADAALAGAAFTARKLAVGTKGSYAH